MGKRCPVFRMKSFGISQGDQVWISEHPPDVPSRMRQEFFYPEDVPRGGLLTRSSVYPPSGLPSSPGFDHTSEGRFWGRGHDRGAVGYAGRRSVAAMTTLAGGDDG